MKFTRNDLVELVASELELGVFKYDFDSFEMEELKEIYLDDCFTIDSNVEARHRWDKYTKVVFCKDANGKEVDILRLSRITDYETLNHLLYAMYGELAINARLVFDDELSLADDKNILSFLNYPMSENEILIEDEELMDFLNGVSPDVLTDALNLLGMIIVNRLEHSMTVRVLTDLVAQFYFDFNDVVEFLEEKLENVELFPQGCFV